jgi:predicted nucleotide-binding protein (sugar kinase/HSP70/actin superfamily)
VLDEIGFPDVPIFSPNQDTSFYMELGIVGKDFSRQAWKGVTAIDLLMKCLHETRPYEVNLGETEHLYNSYLKKVADMVRSHNGKPVELLRDMNTAFSRVPKNNEKRPLIGIIGEIFVRQNTFSNEDLIKKVEALGGEVWLAPLEEWIYYVNLMASRKALLQWKKNIFSRECFDEVLSVYLTRFVQSLRTRKEPSTKEILNNASPYLQDSFEGETILSIGKAVDFVKNGASGIISAMPFGCMPGTIVGALLKGVKQDTGIPFLSIAYDGAEANCSELQLEAFIHQTIEYENNKGKGGD